MPVDVQLRKEREERWSELDSEFSRWKPHFRSLRQYVQPRRGRFDLGEDRSDEWVSSSIIDAEARFALRTLESGLMSGMTSPSRPWFKLGIRGLEGEDTKARQWLHEVQIRMYEVLRVSNIYNVLPMQYRELGLFGTSSALILPDFDNVLHGYPMTMGEYRIATDKRGRVDTVYRRMRKTVKFIVETFGIDNVSPATRLAFEQGRLGEKTDIFHAIEPNRDRQVGSIAPRDRAWTSVYWEEQSSDGMLLEISGHKLKPFLGTRWEVLPDEDYGFSPGMDALGDTKQLQSQHFFKAEAIQKQVRPPMVAPTSMKNAADRPNTSPSGVTYLDAASLQKGGFRSAYDVRPDINGLMIDINQTQDRIRRAFFADLFLLTAQSDRRTVTATEIEERHEEKLVVLGPVLERLQNELLGPLIDLTFSYMQDGGIIPEAPEGIVGSAVKVEYISLLAQAQRSVGVAAIERTVGFAGSLVQLGFTEALDKIDPDQAIDEFANMVGPAPSTVRSDKAVAQIRAQKAQQQQQQMLLENAKDLAGAADTADAITIRGQEGAAQQAPL